jgi:hypothetical protein
VTLNSLLLGLLVFVCALAYDAVNATYIRAMVAGKTWRAVTCTVAVYLVGILGVLIVVRDSLWFMIPETLGLALGTWLGVAAGRDHD